MIHPVVPLTISEFWSSAIAESLWSQPCCELETSDECLWWEASWVDGWKDFPAPTARQSTPPPATLIRLWRTFCSTAPKVIYAAQRSSATDKHQEGPIWSRWRNSTTASSCSHSTAYCSTSGKSFSSYHPTLERNPWAVGSWSVDRNSAHRGRCFERCLRFHCCRHAMNLRRDLIWVGRQQAQMRNRPKRVKVNVLKRRRKKKATQEQNWFKAVWGAEGNLSCFSFFPKEKKG